ncbi:MAG: aldose epimerase family protein [Planctomycetota bacterium]
MSNPLRFAFLTATLALTGCRAMGTSPRIAETVWGSAGGQEVRLYTLRNERGLVMKVTDYGAIITELHLPDRDGRFADVVLGHDSLDGYLDGHPYFGCIAGRCANRIARGRFLLDGKSYQLACNNGPNHLHGGDVGFDKHIWEAETMDTPAGPAIRLSRLSPAGEEGYPGNLRATVTYTLTHANELVVEMAATTDAPTLCNLAQHTYWNLAGHASGPVLDHLLALNAERYVPVDETLIPIGAFARVAGTPFDFRTPKPIGRDLSSVGGDPVGYDHDFVLEGDPAVMKLAARVVEPVSGRVLEVRSDQPGCQFYGGNFLDGSEVGKGGAAYRQYGGFCLETQRHPDSIHHPDWPTVVLRPGEEYRHTIVFAFGIEPRAGGEKGEGW